MSHHKASIAWQLGGREFDYNTYSRNHLWQFGAHTQLTASAAPEYLGDGDHVDPEQAFVASVASCHMLTFLAIASRKRLKVLSYRDDSVGWLEKNHKGQLAVTRIELCPRIEFADSTPCTSQMTQKIHDQAHHECFIANSVSTAITVVAPAAE